MTSILASTSARVLEGFVCPSPVAVGHSLGFEQPDGIKNEPTQSIWSHLPKRRGNHRHGDQNNAGAWSNSKFSNQHESKSMMLASSDASNYCKKDQLITFWILLIPVYAVVKPT